MPRTRTLYLTLARLFSISTRALQILYFMCFNEAHKVLEISIDCTRTQYTTVRSQY